MASSSDRRRIEIPGALHAELERHARQLHISTAALATIALGEYLQAAEARAQIPFHARAGMTAVQAVCNHEWTETNGGKVLMCGHCGMALQRVGG